MTTNITKAVSTALCAGLTMFAATQAQANVIDWFDVNGISYEIATDYSGAMVTSVYGTHSSQITIPERVTNPHTGSAYTVTRIGWAALGSDIDWDVDFVFFPKTIEYIDEFFLSYSVNVKALNVDPANPNYASTDGVLMNKEKDLLIRYPRIKPGSTYEIPATVTKLGELCFVWCDLLTEIYIPDSVTEIGMSAFGGCVNLTTVRLSASIKSLAGQMFWHCDYLKEVIIPEGVEEIGEGFFGQCMSLKKVEFPASVKSLGEEMFLECGELEGVYFNGNAPEAENIFVFWDEESTSKAIVYYREGTTGWGDTFCGRPTAVWNPSEKPTVHFDPPTIVDGKLVFNITCPAGTTLESSTDLKTWTPVTVEGNVYTVDTTVGKHTYYRIKAE